MYNEKQISSLLTFAQEIEYYIHEILVFVGIIQRKCLHFDICFTRDFHPPSVRLCEMMGGYDIHSSGMY